MKRIILLVLAITAVAMPLPAQSKPMDTTDGLSSACRSYVQLANNALPATSTEKYTQAGFCIGYMAGFAHAISSTSTPDFCLPESINLGVVVKAFLKYVDEHPQELQLSAKVTVPHALQQAYPCKSKQ
jgi:Ssp1 endopeptidase immunity protein Rap1a